MLPQPSLQLPTLSAQAVSDSFHLVCQDGSALHRNHVDFVDVSLPDPEELCCCVSCTQSELCTVQW